MSHARLAPSNESWPFCPGQPRENAKYPDTSGDAAMDGTGSHLLLEMSLISNTKADFFKGQTIGVGHEDKPKGWFIDTDRIKRVKMVINYIDRRTCERAEQHKGCTIQVLAELRSNPGMYAGRDDWYGTADVTIVVINVITNELLYLELVDLKDGIHFVGVNKYGRLNTQLISYLSGKVLENKIRNDFCRITIVQPRSKTPIRYKDISTADLIEEYLWLKGRAEATDDPNAPLIADNEHGKGWCKWCRHRNNCEALAESLKGGLAKMTTDVQSPLFVMVSQMFGEIESMENDKIQDFVDCEAPFMGLFDRAKKEIERRISLGVSFDRYCMKPGKSSNEWTESEEEMFKILKSKKLKKDEIYVQKFASVAQIMASPNLTDKQKKDIEALYVKKKAGALKLSKKSDHGDDNSIASFMDEIQKDIQKDKQQNKVIKYSFI